MRVLVTGGTGQLGREIVTAFGAHEVVPTDRARLDVTDRDAVLAAITSVRPDIVVHAAAWTAVDTCESDPDRAFAVNAFGTRNVAEGTRRVGGHLCQISTDYVFSGKKETPYVEWDETHPISVYGRSKLGGEQEAATNADSTIVRVSWVCGAHGHNLVKTALRLAADEQPLRFVVDQRSCVTFADDAAATIHRLAVERRPGIFHVTNQGSLTPFELAKAALESAGLDPDRVEGITTPELVPERPARRPSYSVLENLALRTSGLPLLPHYRESLDRLVRALVSD